MVHRYSAQAKEEIFKMNILLYIYLNLFWWFGGDGDKIYSDIYNIIYVVVESFAPLCPQQLQQF